MENQSFFPTPVTAIILAGGASARMQQEKSTLKVGDNSLIGHILKQLVPVCHQVLISSNHPQRYPFPGVKVVPDRLPGCGPLMGIISALSHSLNEVNFVIACDIPEIDLAFVQQMVALSLESDGVIPLDAAGRYEPLFAIYKKTMLPRLAASLKEGVRKIALTFRYFDLAHPQLDAHYRLWNLNKKRDYIEYLQHLAEEANK